MSLITLPNHRRLYLGPKEVAFQNTHKYVLSIFNPNEERRYGSQITSSDRLHLEAFDRDDAVVTFSERTEDLIDFLNTSLEDTTEKTLVHCNQGKCRSPLVVLLYLVHRFDLTTLEAEVYLSCQYKYSLAGWARDYLDSLI